MGVPTQQELEQALNIAKIMREEGEDPFFLAKSLLNTHYRMELLQKAVHHAKLYLRSGHGSHEHTLLLRAIEKAERASVTSTDELKY